MQKYVCRANPSSASLPFWRREPTRCCGPRVSSFWVCWKLIRSQPTSFLQLVWECGNAGEIDQRSGSFSARNPQPPGPFAVSIGLVASFGQSTAGLARRLVASGVSSDYPMRQSREATNLYSVDVIARYLRYMDRSE